VIGLATLAVMTRASRGHTGRALTASRWTSAVYVLIACVAVLRPLAEVLPEFYHPILVLSATGWIAGFAIFVAEHAPMLTSPSRHGSAG
jgi:uncharacterized protein involved in response to NO